MNSVLNEVSTDEDYSAVGCISLSVSQSQDEITFDLEGYNFQERKTFTKNLVFTVHSDRPTLFYLKGEEDHPFTLTKYNPQSFTLTRVIGDKNEAYSFVENGYNIIPN